MRLSLYSRRMILYSEAKILKDLILLSLTKLCDLHQEGSEKLMQQKRHSKKPVKKTAPKKPEEKKQ